jgi:hypothetical protein
VIDLIFGLFGGWLLVARNNICSSDKYVAIYRVQCGNCKSYIVEAGGKYGDHCILNV